MQVTDAVLLRRSVRQFLPAPISGDILTRLIDQGRFYASAGNLQPVRFAIVTSQKLRDAIFQTIGWAKYLSDYQIPENRRPTAYILLLRDETVSQRCDFDMGAAATTVMLAAKESGLDSCCLASFSSKAVDEIMALPAHLTTAYIIALGYGAQDNTTEDYTDSQKYHLTPNGDFIVPKRTLADVLVYSDCK